MRNAISPLRGMRFQCVHDLIAHEAARHPDAPAVVSRDACLTYRRLNDRAAAIAHALRASGIGPERLVGVYVDRSADMVAALLGIWKAGGAYVPLDPAFPADRLRFMLEDSNARVLLTDRKLQRALPGYCGEVILLEDIPTCAPEIGLEPATALSPESLAYVIYTSGTSGEPKGVEVCHGGLVHILEAVRRDMQIQSETVLAIATIAFDVAGLELYLPLLSGGSVHIAPSGCSSDPERLARALTESRATMMFATASTWRLLVESGWSGDRRLRVASGGEVLTIGLARELMKRTREVWNHYGPTETTICATSSRIRENDDSVTIGRPLEGVRIHILDGDLRPVPPGTEGELYIGGPVVGRGYLNRPELTAASFLADPFSPECHARLYKTGDLVRALPDGNLDFLGRLDGQCKVRGFRIEFEEIEEAIRQYDAVRDAAVREVEFAEGDRRLCAYLSADREIAVGPLKEQLRKRLPPYMVPSVFVFMDALPRTPSGKLDRKALPAPARPAQSDPATSAALLTEFESGLKEIWESILQTTVTGPGDDFFDLGGHSLAAVRLFKAIEQQYGVKLPISTLVECPTLGKLAARLHAQRPGTVGPALIAIQRAGRKPPLFVVPGLGGSLLPFRALSSELGVGQPIYGLQPLSQITPEMTIEEIASRHIDEIQAVWPSGPYCLGGLSWGGLVAFEMARGLSAQGKEIRSLVLFDSDLTLAGPSRGVLHLPSWKSFRRRIRAKLPLLSYALVKEALGRRVARVRFRYRVGLCVRSGSVGPHTFAPDELLAAAACRYAAPPYNGDAVLFVAEDEPGRDRRDRSLGWSGKFSGKLEVIPVAGTHLDLFRKPGVRKVAAELVRRFGDAPAATQTLQSDRGRMCG